jgi:hypothetical protein
MSSVKENHKGEPTSVPISVFLHMCQCFPFIFYTYIGYCIVIRLGLSKNLKFTFARLIHLSFSASVYQ